MLTAKQMIRQNYTYDQALTAYSCGWTSKESFKRFLFLWTWGAARFYGKPKQQQERFIAQFGIDSLYNRFARTNCFVSKWIKPE